jgi:FkbM family methyltransferase
MLRWYYRHTPLRTGRAWLCKQASRWFLVCPVEPDLWFRIFDFDHLSESQLFLGHRFEPATTDLVRELLRPGMVVFDVGANLGRFALQAARAVGPEGQVHAFEPTADILRRLSHNAALNALDNVVAVRAAVAEQPGDVTLHQCDRITEINSIYGAQTDLYDDRPWHTTTVPCISLDSYCREQDIGHVDFVKIDVEGAELSVLRGARELLDGDQAPLLLVEFFPAAMERAGYDEDVLRAELVGLGYECRLVERLEPLDWNTRNVLAVKPGHAARFPNLADAALERL